MANPSYSLDNSSFVTLPGAYRFGGRPASHVEDDIYLRSDSGVKFVYSNFGTDTWELIFRLSASQLTTHRTMHDAAGGRLNTFYFSPTGAGASDSVLVRKVDPNFEPQELDQRAGGGSYYDYVLRLEEEIP